MKITVLGSGDAFGSGGRFNTCLHVEAGGAAILLDCGSSSMTALNRAGVDRNGLSAVLFTHFHADHFGALPAFLLDAQLISRRKDPLTIAGPRGIAQRTATLLEAHFPGASSMSWRFPLSFDEIAPDRPGNVAGLAVEAFPVDHDERAGPCQGYRLAHGGKIFAYSGDTCWTEGLVPLAAGADVLLLECCTFEQKLPGHLDYRTVMEKRPQLSASRIILTHMGDSMLQAAEPLALERAHDGLVILP